MLNTLNKKATQKLKFKASKQDQKQIDTYQKIKEGNQKNYKTKNKLRSQAMKATTKTT